MSSTESYRYLVFDGDCGVCSYSAEVAQRMDGGRRFIVRPYQQFSDLELNRLSLSAQACQKAVKVVSPNGRVYSGAFAVNYFLFFQFPWSIFVVLGYLLPPMLLIEIIAYKVVAANRGLVSRMLGLEACRPESLGPSRESNSPRM